MKYFYIIEPATDDSYPAYVLNPLGRTTSAGTRDELQTKLRDSVATYIEFFKEEGQNVPLQTCSVIDIGQA